MTIRIIELNISSVVCWVGWHSFQPVHGNHNHHIVLLRVTKLGYRHTFSSHSFDLLRTDTHYSSQLTSHFAGDTATVAFEKFLPHNSPFPLVFSELLRRPSKPNRKVSLQNVKAIISCLKKFPLLRTKNPPHVCPKLTSSFLKFLHHIPDSQPDFTTPTSSFPWLYFIN